MKQLNIIEEAIKACSVKESDVDFLCRHSVSGDAEKPLRELLFDNLCRILQADPNMGVLSMDHAFEFNGQRLTIDIVKWADERQMKPEFMLTVTHNGTFESPAYAPNKVRRNVIKCAGFAGLRYPDEYPDIYAVSMLTHIYMLDPFYRYKLRKAFYNGIIDARDKRVERLSAIEKEFMTHSRSYELSTSDVLFRHDGYLGFGLENHYFICDGSFEQKSNRQLFEREFPVLPGGKALGRK